MAGRGGKGAYILIAKPREKKKYFANVFFCLFLWIRRRRGTLTALGISPSPPPPVLIGSPL